LAVSRFTPTRLPISRASSGRSAACNNRHDAPVDIGDDQSLTHRFQHRFVVLVPAGIRGFYPGVTYQIGNLLAALNLPLLAVIIATALGQEAKGAVFGRSPGPGIVATDLTRAGKLR
jgi:hypothetical protein